MGRLPAGRLVEADSVSRDWLRLAASGPASGAEWAWLRKPADLPGPDRQMCVQSVPPALPGSPCGSPPPCDRALPPCDRA